MNERPRGREARPGETPQPDEDDDGQDEQEVREELGDATNISLSDLVHEPLWVAWRTEMRGPPGKEKPTKVPYTAPECRAESDNPATWLTHDAAAAVADMIGGGVGIMLGGRRIGIDLDTCRDPLTGVIEPWAQAVLDRFGTYSEVSPSLAGIKVYPLIDPADIEQIRSMMGSKHGRSWKRANGSDHPPAIELFISHRFFAVTWQGLDDYPSELRPVSLDDMRWVIEVAGPAFAGKTDSTSAGGGRGDDAAPDDENILARLARAAESNAQLATAIRNAATMKGGSRSEGALGLGAALKRAGWSYQDMKAALLACPATREWAAEKLGEGDRQFERIWRKGDEEAGTKQTDAETEPRPSDTSFTPEPWAWRDPTTLQPRQWLLGTTLLRGYATVLGSAGGIGKTAYAVACALAVVTGRRNIVDQHVFQTGKVWLITLEDDREELERRIAAAMLAHRINREDVEGRLFVNDASRRPLLLAKADPSGTFIVCEDAERLTNGIRQNDILLTVIDPLVKSHRAIENSNEHMDRLIGLGNDMARDTSSAILLPCHFRKGGGEDGARDAIRGGGALVDGSRITRTLIPMTAKEAEAFKLPPEDAFRQIRVHDPKANMAPKQLATWFQLLPVPLGNTAVDLTYPAGDNVQAAIPWRPPSAFEGIDAVALRRIFERLRGEAEPGWSYSPEPRSKFWAGIVIIEEAGKSREQATAVLKAWSGSGVFTTIGYETPHRHDGSRVVLNEHLVAEMLAPIRQFDE